MRTEEAATGLSALVEQLAGPDWRRAAEAERALVATGAAGTEAVLRGMRDGRAIVRRACARFMDHHGDDACVVGLTERLLSDPVPSVRREAVHSLSCQRCKQSPLAADLVPTLLGVLRDDPNAKVRREAIFGLGQQPRDERAVAALRELADAEPNPDLRKRAHHTLRRLDPAYRAEVAARAREANRQERQDQQEPPPPAANTAGEA